MTKAVKNYQKACLDLANTFVNGYYAHFDGEEAVVEPKEYTLERFVSCDSTDIFEFCGMYITVKDIYNFYVEKATYDQFRDWYWEVVEGRMDMNLRNYLKLK